MFKIEINTDNAAFNNMPGIEIARILREAADKAEIRLCAGRTDSFPLRDFNGNVVGMCTFESED
jgi:hypothetical protein